MWRIPVMRPVGRQWPRSTHYRSVHIIKSVAEMRAWRRERVIAEETVGLVPTMGALHTGHLQLVERSSTENSATVVSIFVNPSQFAPHEDLDRYPRTMETDLAKIEKIEKSAGTPIAVFIPSVRDMYPSGITLEVSHQTGAFVEVKGLSNQLEGAMRPQFFRGVATIVTKLLNIITPERAYFGQKDVQQSVVVRRLVKDLLLPTEIIVAATVREPNGLAMSSRNEYLSPESRHNARILFEALSAGEAAYKSGKTSRPEIIDAVNHVLSESAFPTKVEYIALSDKETMLELDAVIPGVGAIMSGAIRVPNKEGTMTRIIDNIILE